MKIDLHCHTKKMKIGDACTRDVGVDKFSQKINEANVKIVAITNHNFFDLEQYEIFSESVKEYCKVWPGIELDIKGNNNRGHLIVIANPINAKLFSDKVKLLIGNSKPDDFIIDLKSVYDKLNECDVLYVPHFHKDPKISEEDIEELNSLLEDKSRLFKETSDYRSLGVFSNFNYSVIIGSDVQNWDIYEKGKFAKLRLPVQTFEQFCLLAKKDKVIIDTLLNRKNKTIVPVSPHKSSHFYIPIFADVNIIFGQKGTGKSELLKSIKLYYEEKNITYKMYTGSDKEIDFSKLLSNKEMKRDIMKMNAHDKKDEFENIYQWKEMQPVNLMKYIQWGQTRDNNKNKSKMKITNAVNLEEFKKNEQLEKDFKVVKQFTESDFISLNLTQYIDKSLVVQFYYILNNLLNRVYEKKRENWIELNSAKLTNWSINKIKTIADKCSDTVSKPSSTGFEEFANNRLKLYEMAESICNELEVHEVNEKEYIGMLEEKGEIFLQKKYRFLCKESKTEEFEIGITKLKGCKNAIDSIKNNFSSLDLQETLSQFRDLYDNEKIRDLTCFLGISKSTVLEDGSIYVPSGGEKGILLLQKLLSSDCEVYLLDEPELGMGNSYITASILPNIEDLAHRKKTVVIATHNANIAVKTLPYISIFRKHKNGKYFTYVGNPFCDELVNIEDESDQLCWTNESMHTLEGGRDAFYGRRDIYESGRTDN